jgi:hypothetical protein
MRSISIRLLSLVVAVCAALSLPACGGGGSGSSPRNENPNLPPAAKPPLTGGLDPSTIALMVGNQQGGAAGQKALLQVDPAGAVTAVTFRDEDAHAVGVSVTSVEALGDGMFALDLSYVTSTSQTRTIRALWRTSDGRLFDLSAYNLAGAQLKGNDLFVLSSALSGSSYTLYHVDVASLDASLVATPMNNPAYDVLAYPAPKMLVDRDLDVLIEAHFGVSNMEYETFFHDNSAPFTQARSEGLVFCPTGGRGWQLASAYGEDGQVYVFCINEVPDLGSSLVRYLRYEVRRVDFTAAGPVVLDPVAVRTTTCSGATPQTISCPESRLASTTPYKLQNRSRYIPLTSGYFTMSPVTGGGLTFTWTDLALPSAATSLISGSYLYWKEVDTIRRIRFEAGAAPEDLVTATSIIGWQVANGVVIYTRHDTGTSIGTYKVTGPGAAPVRMMSDDMQVQHIVEL